MLLFFTVLLGFLIDARGESVGDPLSGRAIYLKNCAHCHGKRGEGLGPRASMPNFSDPKYMVGKNDRELFEKITRGGQGTGMPSFGKSLDEKERWNVIAYLRTLSSPQ